MGEASMQEQHPVACAALLTEIKHAVKLSADLGYHQLEHTSDLSEETLTSIRRNILRIPSPIPPDRSVAFEFSEPRRPSKRRKSSKGKATEEAVDTKHTKRAPKREGEDLADLPPASPSSDCLTEATVPEGSFSKATMKVEDDFTAFRVLGADAEEELMRLPSGASPPGMCTSERAHLNAGLPCRRPATASSGRVMCNR